MVVAFIPMSVCPGKDVVTQDIFYEKRGTVPKPIACSNVTKNYLISLLDETVVKRIKCDRKVVKFAITPYF